MIALLKSLADQARQVDIECRRVILNLFEHNPQARLLDLGCADGELTLIVAERIGTEGVSGVDAVDENIAKAHSKGIDAYRADLNQELPFTDESFDVVCASHCIEHLSDTDIFVRETFRVLRRGGYLVMAAPNLAALHNILFLILGKQPTVAEVSDEALVGTISPRGACVDRVGPAHRRMFTFGALEGLLRHYGYMVERTLGSGYLPLPTRIARGMCRVDRLHSTNIVVKARKPACQQQAAPLQDRPTGVISGCADITKLKNPGGLGASPRQGFRQVNGGALARPDA